MKIFKRIITVFIAIILATSSAIMSTSAASVTWTSRYDTLASIPWGPQNKAKTKTFTVQGKNNKKLCIQMHVGYDNSDSAYAQSIGYKSASDYYNVIKNKTRFDITVKDAKGKIVASYKNVKYGHVTVFNCSKQKYTVTVKSYFSSFNAGISSDRAASFYAQWSSSYYFK